jgi:hypothetical protein
VLDGQGHFKSGDWLVRVRALDPWHTLLMNRIAARGWRGADAEPILQSTENYRTDLAFRAMSAWMRALGWGTRKTNHALRAYAGSQIAMKYGRLFLGPNRAVVPKPIGEANRCNPGRVTPKNAPESTIRGVLRRRSTTTGSGVWLGPISSPKSAPRRVGRTNVRSYALPLGLSRPATTMWRRFVLTPIRSFHSYSRIVAAYSWK